MSEYASFQTNPKGPHVNKLRQYQSMQNLHASYCHNKPPVKRNNQDLNASQLSRENIAKNTRSIKHEIKTVDQEIEQL